jgi:hypothetical protein
MSTAAEFRCFNAKRGAFYDPDSLDSKYSLTEWTGRPADSHTIYSLQRQDFSREAIEQSMTIDSPAAPDRRL